MAVLKARSHIWRVKAFAEEMLVHPAWNCVLWCLMFWVFFFFTEANGHAHKLWRDSSTSSVFIKGPWPYLVCGIISFKVLPRTAALPLKTAHSHWVDCWNLPYTNPNIPVYAQQANSMWYTILDFNVMCNITLSLTYRICYSLLITKHTASVDHLMQNI